MRRMNENITVRNVWKTRERMPREERIADNKCIKNRSEIRKRCGQNLHTREGDGTRVFRQRKVDGIFTI